MLPRETRNLVVASLLMMPPRETKNLVAAGDAAKGDKDPSCC